MHMTLDPLLPNCGAVLDLLLDRNGHWANLYLKEVSSDSMPRWKEDWYMSALLWNKSFQKKLIEYRHSMLDRRSNNLTF